MLKTAKKYVIRSSPCQSIRFPNPDLPIPGRHSNRELLCDSWHKGGIRFPRRMKAVQHEVWSWQAFKNLTNAALNRIRAAEGEH